MGAYGYLAFLGKKKNAKFPIFKRTVTIGRDKSNDIRICNDSVLNKHLQVTVQSKKGSSEENLFDFILKVFNDNSVKVNDQPICQNEDVILENLDEIIIANHRFVLKTSATNGSKPRRSSVKRASLTKRRSSRLSSCWRRSTVPKPSINSTALDNICESQFFTVDETFKTCQTELTNQSELFVTVEEVDNQTLAEANKPDEKSAHSLNETFSIESEHSPSKPSTPVVVKDDIYHTPTAQSLPCSPLIKSALRAPGSGLKSASKSVKFNRLVEQKLLQFDGKTGASSSTKVSTPLFDASTPIEPVRLNFTKKAATASRIPVFKSSSVLRTYGGRRSCDTVGRALNFDPTELKQANEIIEATDSNSATVEDSTEANSEQPTVIETATLVRSSKTPDTDYEKHANCIKSPLPPETPKADYQPNIVKKLIKPKTPAADYEKHANCIKSLLPPETPKADYEAHVDALKKLIQPKTPAADYEKHANCIKSLLPLGTPKADYESNIEGVKQLVQPKTPVADYEKHANCIKSLLPPETPKADYESNIEGVKKLVQPQTPVADYEKHANCIKNLLPLETPKADYESHVEGVKILIQPGTPAANYEKYVNCIKELIPPGTPKADYETHIEGLKQLIQPSTPAADYERYINCIKDLLPPETPKADYETHIEGLKKLTQPGTPEADYEKHVNCIKNLQPAETPKADYVTNVGCVRHLMQKHTPIANYDLNVSTIHDLFQVESEDDKSEILTPIQPPRRLRTRNVLATPAVEKETKKAEEKPRRERKVTTRSKAKESKEDKKENKENVVGTRRSTRKRKVQRDEIDDLINSGDESEHKNQIDIGEIADQVEKIQQKPTKSTISKPASRGRRKKTVEETIDEKLSNVDILDVTPEMIIDMIDTKQSTTGRKRKATAISEETPRKGRVTGRRNVRSKPEPKTSQETDTEVAKPKTASRRFKVQLPTVEMDVELVKSKRSYPATTFGDETHDSTVDSARITRSRTRRR